MTDLIQAANTLALANQATRGEAAEVRCAIDFVETAKRHIEAGDYAGMLSCLRLAGRFADDASNSFYDRVHRG